MVSLEEFLTLTQLIALAAEDFELNIVEGRHL